MLLFERHAITGAHGLSVMPATLADADASFCRHGETVPVILEAEVGRGLAWTVISADAEVLVDAKRIDDFARVHLPIRVPGALEFAKRFNDLSAVQLWQKFGLRLAVAVLARIHAAVANDQIGRFLHVLPVCANSFSRPEIEGNPSVHAALTEVSVQRAGVMELVVERLEIAQISAQLFRRDRRILPALPCDVLAGYECRSSKPGFTDLPNETLLVRVVVQLHRRRALFLFQGAHHCMRSGVGLLLRFRAEFNQ